MEDLHQPRELATTTAEGFLTIYSPEAIGRSFSHIRSAQDALALADTQPSLGDIRRNYGTGKAEVIIKMYLLELCELINLKRSLTERQIDAIAREVVADYCFLSTADIHVIFRRARRGEWGELYESLDMPKVMRWFSDYFHERCMVCEEMAIASQASDKWDNITSERMSKYFAALEKKTRKET